MTTMGTAMVMGKEKEERNRHHLSAPVRVGQYWMPIPLLGVDLSWMVLHRQVNMAPPDITR